MDQLIDHLPAKVMSYCFGEWLQNSCTSTATWHISMVFFQASLKNGFKEVITNHTSTGYWHIKLPFGILYRLLTLYISMVFSRLLTTLTICRKWPENCYIVNCTVECVTQSTSWEDWQSCTSSEDRHVRLDGKTDILVWSCNLILYVQKLGLEIWYCMYIGEEALLHLLPHFPVMLAWGFFNCSCYSEANSVKNYQCH